jgi:hypothetical protein
MTNGQIGEPIEGYDAGKAALYWGLNPQEAIKLPLFWIEWAAIVSQVEEKVRKAREDSKSKSGGKSGNATSTMDLSEAI